MPTNFRSSTGSSRRGTLQEHQEDRDTGRQTPTRNSDSHPSGSTQPPTLSQIASSTRHHQDASSIASSVHTEALELTSPSLRNYHSNNHSNNVLPSLRSDNLHIATLNALGDWTGGILGLADYFPAYWDEDIDDEYDDEYEEDVNEFGTDSDEEGEEDEDEDEEEEEEEEEEEDDEDQDYEDFEDLDDFGDQDTELLALAEEESLFLEDNLFLEGDERETILTQGFHQHQALLELLIGDELSSTSSYSSFLHDHPWHVGLDQSNAPSPRPGSRPVRTAAQHNRSPLSPLRTTTQQTDLTADSVFITDDEDEDHTPNTSFSSEMPAVTRRGSHQSAQAEPPTKRRRTSTANLAGAGSGNKLEPIKLDDDDVFGDAPTRKRTEGTGEDLPTLDLTNATEVPEELKAPYKDNRIKLAAFQCVICMDDVSALTVTHCGHLYCAECLHSSIHSGATKGRCPMCRQKLEVKPRENYTSKTKGHWLLELKVKTSTRKGKRKAGAQ